MVAKQERLSSQRTVVVVDQIVGHGDGVLSDRHKLALAGRSLDGFGLLLGLDKEDMQHHVRRRHG